MSTEEKKEEFKEEYVKLLPEYVAEAEVLFGKKTDYKFIGIFYHAFPPRMILHDIDILEGDIFFKIELSNNVIHDRKNGIFQLSHEVVHLLSPVNQTEDEDNVNYLEEGMAVYFSKLITERETGDLQYCDVVTVKHEKYSKAYDLYLKLKTIDEDAVKKLRAINPIIANLKAEDFTTAALNVPDDLIQALLTKF